MALNKIQKNFIFSSCLHANILVNHHANNKNGMSKIFPKTASSQQIQRHYRSLFNYVIETGEPLIVLNNNTPEVVIIDINTYAERQSKIEAYEQSLARQAINTYKQEKEKNKLKKLNFLSSLEHEN